MATAVSSATISLTIANEKTGEPVTYKQDGKRFTHDVTIKLSVNTSYVISVTLVPAEDPSGSGRQLRSTACREEPQPRCWVSPDL